MINKNHLTVATLVAGLALLVGCRPANAADGKDRTSSSSEASISTNDNGTVSRTFVESSVTTNGNMVTERRRETRTSTDAEGNLLATSTSEYAQSYSLGETLAEPAPAAPEKQADDKAALAPAADSFLGVKFGEEVPGVTNFVRDAAELGLNKSMLLLGHCASERDGMSYLCDLCAGMFPSCECRYFDCGELYTYPED